MGDEEGTSNNAAQAASHNNISATKNLSSLLMVVQKLDGNSESMNFASQLAWPVIQTIDNITTKSGRNVRAKMYLPPELRINEIFKFPMVVHV